MIIPPDVNCPYCGQGLEICHDDGYGYEEEEFHSQECGHCEKTFSFTTSIHYYYEAKKADCMNGEKHNWKPMLPCLKSRPDAKICAGCGERKSGRYVGPEQ